MSETTTTSVPEAWAHPWVRHPGLKRALDLVGSGLGLAMLAPLFLLIAGLIKLSSPGPVFYRGRRTGRFNVSFGIYKFRSMVLNADRIGGSTTGKNDPRVTRIGAFIRRCKLDELPQLINVFLGDMSLVGPRPEVEEYTRLFTGEELIILAVRPGITDLSSLHFIDLQEHVGSEDPDLVFRRDILPVKNRFRVEYVKTQSFLGDIRIILRTFSKLFFKSRKPSLAPVAREAS